MPIKDLTGERYGRLLVLSIAGRDKYKRLIWKCKCDCGNTHEVLSNHLRVGAVKSCGCLAKEVHTKHGKHDTKEYHAWEGIKDRCYNKNNGRYNKYGGRGIKVCDRWKDSFENFYEDMGDKPSQNHSIDRIDVNGNYEPNNCRWATYDIQAINKGLQSNNNTKIVGVCWEKNYGGRWRATFYENGKTIYLGVYQDFFEACCIRKSAEAKSKKAKYYFNR